MIMESLQWCSRTKIMHLNAQNAVQRILTPTHAQHVIIVETLWAGVAHNKAAREYFSNNR